MSGGLVPGAEWLPLLAELAAKATFIMLAAAVAAALLWRASAAVRHLVWCVGVVGVLALPVFAVVLPAWEVPVLPAAPAAPAIDRDAGIGDKEEAGRAAPALPASAPPRPAREAWLPRAAAGLVAAGVAAGLLWLALGFWGVARLGRRAQVVRDPEWLRAAHEAAERLGLRRPVLLLRHRGTVMPATGGLLWPSVVLPANADEWCDDRRRAVLAHELAHVKRFDTLTQALAQVACALFWWHPAVWYAAKRLRVERERACDDLVLRSGTRASDYAAHLLEIARAHRSLRLASSALVSMARPSHLESRLLWVLDAARARGVPSARATLLTVLAGLLVVGPLAAMRPIQAPARQDAASILGARGGTLGSLEALADEAYDAAVNPDEEYDEETGKDGPDSSGDADFPAAAAHAQALAQVDTPPERPDVETLIALREAGVSARYIAEMRDAGYDRLSVRELVAMASNGVSARYAREMNAAGWGRLDPGELVGLAANGVTPAWLAELRRAGVEPQSPSEAVGMAGSGVSAEFIAEMRAAGYTGLSAAELAHLGSNGADAEYVRELAAAGLRDIPARHLATLASVGVNARYIAGLREVGLSGLDARTLAELRSNGVTPAYIREMAGVGLGGLTVRQLMQLRSNDVTAAYVRELAEAGFAHLTVEQLVRLRASGVDDELVESRRRSRTP